MNSGEKTLLSKIGARIATSYCLTSINLEYITRVRQITMIDDFSSWDESHSSKRLAELPEVDEWRTRERQLLYAMKEEAVLEPLGVKKLLRTVVYAFALTVVFLIAMLVGVSVAAGASSSRHFVSIERTLDSFPIPQPKPPCPDPLPSPGPLPLPSPLDCPGPGCPCYRVLPIASAG
jgi:hypothetical protein